MKLHIIISLSLCLVAVSFSSNVMGQPSIYLSGSSSAVTCGNNAGTILSSCNNCTIGFWQEGTNNWQTGVFTVLNTYTGSSLTYNIAAPGSRDYRVGYTMTGSSTMQYSVPLNITAVQIPSAGTLSSTITSATNSASGQLTLTGATGAVTWYQWGSNTPLTLVNGNFTVTQTTEFYASVSNSPCTVNSNHVTVTIYNTGILSAYIGGPTTPIAVTEGDKVQMTVYNHGSGQIQHWEYSIDGGSTWTNFDYNNYVYGGPLTGDRFADTHEIWTNTKFRALVDLGPSGSAYTNILDATFVPYSQGHADPTNGGNSIKEQTVTISGITTPSSVDGLTANQRHAVTSFLDGDGRVVQQNITNSSPMGYDIVGVAAYDRLGRKATSYLQYVSSNYDGAYRTNALSEQSNFYVNGTGDKVADSPNPYATTVFEKSPLQKMTEQGDVGQAFQPGGGHTTIPTYSNNDASNQIRLIQSDGSSTQYYNNNELSLTDIRDADGKHSQTFTNKEGWTIVSRVQLDETVNGVVTPWLETYYVYTTNGAIKYIISPKGVAALKLGGWSLTQSILDQYVHQFIYDALGRPVEKKVPGQAPVYYCYDRFDRVVLMQDANTRTSNKWLFFKYDREGRVIMSGLYINTTYTSRASIQTNVIDPLYAVSTDPYFEERGSAAHGYTNQSFPTAVEVQNVNYYDDYDLDNNGTPDVSYQAQGIAGEGTLISSTALLPTASKRLVLDGGSTWLYNYMFYDTRGRVIQTQSNNHLSSAVNNVVTNIYDFEGKLLTSKTYHDAGSNRTVTTTNSVQYDAAGRTTAVLSSSGQPINQQSQQPFTSTGQSTQWFNVVGVTQNGNNLTKTGGTNGAWDAGAFSTQPIPPGSDGWVEFTAGQTNTSEVIGLSSSDGNASYTTINYGFNPSADGNLYVFENGTQRTSSLGAFATTDVLRVERSGSSIVYKKNGNILYTSSTPSNGVLFADCSFRESNSSLNNINIGVRQGISWNNVVGVTANGNSLKRSGAFTGSWDAGAFSLQSIPANTPGWIEFVAGEANTHKMMGLSSSNVDAGYTSINYALYTAADGSLSAYENGTGVYLATYTNTDILRVERVGSSIVYKKNGVILRTSAISSSDALFADCSFYNANATFNNISIGIGNSDNINIAVSGNTLTKVGGVNGVWDAGAFSGQSIPSGRGGWVEFTVGETNTHKMMGLSDVDGDATYNTIKYALYAAADGNLYIYENGTSITGALSAYNTTDILRVERVGNAICYKKNGVILYTSTITSTSILYADCSFYNTGSSLKNVSMGISQWNNIVNLAASGNTLTKTGGSGASWDAGSFSTQSIPAGVDGYIEFTLGETTTDKMMGLSTIDTNVNYTSIGYAMYPASNGSIYVDESGTAKNGGAAVGSYVVGDVLRVERSGATILYKKNGTVLWTTTGAVTSVLYADCSLKTANATIKNIAIGVSNIQLAKYQYNELGQLVDKKLHSTDGTNFLQSVDFRYDIKGNPISINNANLDVNSANNDETNDYFGMELLYEGVDNNLGTTPCYNGNISTIKWKGVGTASGYDAIRSYRYIYDNANRLKTGVSQIYSSAANSWVKETGALNETMTYDLNGNIQTLQRNTRQYNMTIVNGVPTVTYNQSQIDNLAYAYNSAMGDQLLTVTDATSNASGFDNGSSGINSDYTYDANGSLTSDLNKGISNIVYNHLSKPTSIVYTDGRHVDYTYDAAGTKLTVKAYAAGGLLQTTTDYVGSFVYVNNALSFFSSPEGRIANNNGNMEYQYSIADNQGNTRIVFTSVNPTAPPVTATFEDAVADSKVFQNVNTSSTYWVSKSGANNTSGGQYVIRMNYTYPTGPGKSLQVFPGDVVDPEVYAYYEGSSGFGGSNESLAALITSVASAFGGVSGAPGKEGLIYSGVSAGYNIYGEPTNQGDGVPTAHLNYILFDKDYNFLNMGWQAVPTTANMNKQRVAFPSPINIKEPGYMYVYLSYEGAGTNWVYFDDLKITHTKTNVIQYNEYYPFGLQASTSWTRDNATGNNFLANEGTEINTSTGWYDLTFRNYDPTIGRMIQVDPMATQYAPLSSYHYGFNNPVMFGDPDGAEPSDSPNLPYDISYGPPGGNPGFNPAAWNMIADAWSKTTAATGGNGRGTFSSSGETHYYDRNNTEIEGEGSTFVNSGINSIHFVNSVNFKTDRYGSNVKIKSRAKGGAAQTQGAVILDASGNVKKWDSGANSIFVDFGDGDVRPFRDQLAMSGAMAPEAFSNGLLSIVNGMQLPRGKSFDKNRLLNNGKIMVSLINGVKAFTTRDYVYGKAAYSYSENQGLPKGMMMITYQGIGGDLTVDSLRDTLGYHEYYSHGLRLLAHPRDDERINLIENSHVDPY